MTYSDVVATVALGISLLTASWAGWRAWRWDRPVVSVSGTQWVGGTSSAPGVSIAGFSIEIVNTGNQGTQIIAAYWQIDRGNDVDIHFVASPGGGGIDSLFSGPDAGDAPELPFNLDRYARRTWEFSMRLSGIKDQEQIIRARPVAQFTSRRKTEFAYGGWQPSQIALEARRVREAKSN